MRSPAARCVTRAFRTLPAVLCVLCPPLALAEAPLSADAPETRPASRDVAMVLDGAIGGGSGWDRHGKFAVDFVPRLRFSAFEIGVVAGASAALFQGQDGYYGIVAGYRRRLSSLLELELLGEGGRHEATVYPGLFSSGRGEATLAYVGGRAGLDARFGGRVKLLVGVWGIVRSDLERKHVVAQVTTGGLGGASAALHDFGDVGGTSFQLVLRIGTEIGFGDR